MALKGIEMTLSQENQYRTPILVKFANHRSVGDFIEEFTRYLCAKNAGSTGAAGDLRRIFTPSSVIVAFAIEEGIIFEFADLSVPCPDYIFSKYFVPYISMQATYWRGE